MSGHGSWCHGNADGDISRGLAAALAAEDAAIYGANISTGGLNRGTAPLYRLSARLLACGKLSRSAVHLMRVVGVGWGGWGGWVGRTRYTLTQVSPFLTFLFHFICPSFRLSDRPSQQSDSDWCEIAA